MLNNGHFVDKCHHYCRGNYLPWFLRIRDEQKRSIVRVIFPETKFPRRPQRSLFERRDDWPTFVKSYNIGLPARGPPDAPRLFHSTRCTYITGRRRETFSDGDDGGPINNRQWLLFAAVAVEVTRWPRIRDLEQHLDWGRVRKTFMIAVLIFKILSIFVYARCFPGYIWNWCFENFNHDKNQTSI